MSNLFSPEIVYNYPGTYTVKLRVGRGTENAETEMLKYITVVYPDEITVAFKVLRHPRSSLTCYYYDWSDCQDSRTE